MRNPDKFAYLGGNYLVSFQKTKNYSNCDIKYFCEAPQASSLHSSKLLSNVLSHSRGKWSPALKNGDYPFTTKPLTFWCIGKYRKAIAQLEKIRGLMKNGWEKTKYFLKISTRKLRNHIWEKQDLYLPVLISAILLALVFASKTAFSKTANSLNNLPVKDNYKVRMIGINFENRTEKIYSSENKEYQKELAKQESSKDQNKLKEDIAKIVKNTPMAAMVDSISEKPRPVAAFIVGIAMKESKFGVYAPHKGGRDCYNYWGFKGGGSTVSGGYTCFNSPEQAVDAVSGRIEKMMTRGIRTPAQAISWKCGRSCAGHSAADVRKWISDVAINFYKINS